MPDAYAIPMLEAEAEADIRRACARPVQASVSYLDTTLDLTATIVERAKRQKTDIEMALDNLSCYRCEHSGHLAANCPELRPALNREEHEARIAAYIRRWTDGKITARQKQQLISDENRMWYGSQCRSALTIGGAA